MDATKHTTHDGQSRTVSEDVNDAVINEQVRPHQEEEVTAAVDKEVHQDHHHTTVQPVKAQEKLREQHHQNVAPVQHRTVEHGDRHETSQALDREAEQFKNTSQTLEATQSQSTTTAPVETRERVHHHVHEHIQPVIEKETIQPHIVHTTVPIHETHHAEAVHHGTSVLPAKTLDELEGVVGSVGGGAANRSRQDHGVEDDRRHREHHQHSGQHTTTGKAGGALGAAGGMAAASHGQHQNGGRDVGVRGVNDRNEHGHRVDERGVGSHGAFEEPRARHQESRIDSSAAPAGEIGTGTAGAAQTAAHGKPHHTSSTTTTAAAAAAEDHHSKATHAGTETTEKKPSMADKLNPFKDADGDGHKGFMT